ncbi:MAG: cytochrome c biogenesis protein CcsA [Rhodospirillaceae bacterium]
MTAPNTTLDLMALAALLPALALGRRDQPARDLVFWLVVVAAFVGPFLWSVTAFGSIWRSDLTAALWLSVAATWGLFALSAALDRDAWRLAALLAPLMFLVGLLAVVWSGHMPAKPFRSDLVSGPGLGLHIAVSVATYAFVTLAAIAGCAGILQDRALKAKRPTGLSRGLPSLAACDEMMFRLLAIAEAVLALGLVSGMALNFQEYGRALSFDHKTVLALGAFALIAALLAAHRYSGLRGRKAARWSLAAYLCLTLGYPGVKFVTDILLP